MVVGLFIAFPFLFEGQGEDVVQFIIERINCYVGGNGEQVSHQILPTFKIGLNYEVISHPFLSLIMNLYMSCGKDTST